MASQHHVQLSDHVESQDYQKWIMILLPKWNLSMCQTAGRVISLASISKHFGKSIINIFGKSYRLGQGLLLGNGKASECYLMIYCVCHTDLILWGMFAKIPNHILYFSCHKTNWKYIVRYHNLEDVPYIHLYEFTLWKDAWFVHLFLVKRFEKVSSFLLCQDGTVGKHWTTELNEWLKKISSGLVSHNCMSYYLSKKKKKTHPEKSITLWFHENLTNFFLRNTFALCCACQMWKLQHTQTWNHLSLICSKTIWEKKYTKWPFCVRWKKKIHCVLLNSIIQIFIVQQKVLL